MIYKTKCPQCGAQILGKPRCERDETSVLVNKLRQIEWLALIILNGTNQIYWVEVCALGFYLLFGCRFFFSSKGLSGLSD